MNALFELVQARLALGPVPAAEAMALEKGMIVLMNYREDQITPYFTYFKDGLVEEKY